MDQKTETKMSPAFSGCAANAKLNDSNIETWADVKFNVSNCILFHGVETYISALFTDKNDQYTILEDIERVIAGMLSTILRHNPRYAR